MKRITILSSLLLCGLIWSCNRAINNSTENYGMAVSEETASADINFEAAPESQTRLYSPVTMKGRSETSNNTVSPVQNKKIIRSGNISIASKDIKKTKLRLDNQIKEHDAYYEQESTSAGSTYTNYNLIVRIPANQFDQFISGIENGEDKITDKSIQAKDVSLQYYDVESRLKSKRTYLEQYQKMVSSAKSVKELLEIEEQIRQLQEDIESSESLLRNLSGQISYSTLHISIFYSSTENPAYTYTYWSKIKDSLDTGWEFISNLFLGLISIWPIGIIIATAVWGWKKYKKRKSK